MPRVHEVAKEFGVTSKEVLARLERLGIPAASHASSLDDDAVKRLRRSFASSRSRAGVGVGSAPEASRGAEPRAGDAGSAPEAFPGAEPGDAAAGSGVATEVPVQWGGTVAAARGDEPAVPAGTAPPAAAVPAAPGGKPPVPVAAPADRQPAAPPAARPDGYGGPGGGATTETSAAARPRPGRSKLAKALIEVPILIAIALAIAIVVKSFVVQAFYIPSGSMIPTLRVGDRVLVEKISYRLREPERGDVVVFERSVFGAQRDEPWPADVRNFVRELLGLPAPATEDYIKRVVALGGDVVSYTGRPRRLVVNGKPVDEGYVNHGADRRSTQIRRRDCRRLDMKRRAGGCLVPAGTVFVMGDNRGNSEDSRVIGPIETGKIVGRAFLVAWPPGDFGRI